MHCLLDRTEEEFSEPPDPDRFALVREAKARKKESTVKLATQRKLLLSDNRQKWFDRVAEQEIIDDDQYFASDDDNESEDEEDAEHNQSHFDHLFTHFLSFTNVPSGTSTFPLLLGHSDILPGILASSCFW
jgi:hypothetical protein